MSVKQIHLYFCWITALTLLFVGSGCRLRDGPDPDFESHAEEFDMLARNLRHLQAVSRITKIIVNKTGATTFRTTSEEFWSFEEAKSAVAPEAQLAVERIVELAPRLIINAEVLEDGTFVCLTWSAGVPAGGGYALLGSRGEKALKSLGYIDWYRQINSRNWYEWGT